MVMSRIARATSASSASLTQRIAYGSAAWSRTFTDTRSSASSMVRRQRPSTFIFVEPAQRVNLVPPLVDPIAAWQIEQLDHERALHDLGVHLLDKADRGECRATGREQVVDDEDAFTLAHAVDVGFDPVG